MRNTLGRVFSPILSRSASLTFLAFRRFIVQPGINPNLTDYIRCQPWRAKRRLVVPSSREAALLTRRAHSARGEAK